MSCRPERTIFVLRPQADFRSADLVQRAGSPAALSRELDRAWNLVTAIDAVPGPASGEESADGLCGAFCGPQDSVSRGPHTPNQKTEPHNGEAVPVEWSDPVSDRASLRLLKSGNPYGGCDWLDVSCWVQWDGFKSTRAFEVMAKAVAAYREDPNGDGRFVRIGSTDCEVRPGRTVGNVWMHYECVFEGVSIKMSERKADSSLCNVFIHFGSLPLTVSGIAACWEAAQTFLEEMGGRIDRDVVSRVDYCADRPNENGRKLFAAIVNREYVSEARRGGQEWDDSETFYVRVGAHGADCIFRAYEKAKELRDKGDNVKYEALVAHRWGCRPEEAMRCEFQMRGKFLRTITAEGIPNGIATVADLIAGEGSLLIYLTTEWLRIVQGRGGKHAQTKHYQRTSGLWKKWQDSFACVANSWVGYVHRLKRTSGNADRVRRQGMGCLLKAVALSTDRVPETVEDLGAAVLEQVGHWIESVTIEEGRARARNKQAEVNRLGPWLREVQRISGGDGEWDRREGEAWGERFKAFFGELSLAEKEIPF